MAKVLGLVSFRVYPTHMGGQKGVALFYEHLQKYLPVVLAGSMDNVPTDKVNMKRLLHPNRKIYRNFLALNKLQNLVRSEKVDIVVAEHSYTAWIAWWLQKRTGKPFVIHSHNIESRRFQKMGKWWWRMYAAYEKWVHRKATRNFFISQEDQDYAIKAFDLDPARCSVVTYGILPVSVNKDRARLKQQLGIDEKKTILLFNGTLDYEPNYYAVHTLIDQVEPLLRKKMDQYQILITGNRAPADLASKMMAAPNLEYVGYVDDVNLYYQSADLFLNPVANDTGVKTKLIEAIANNCTAVSTISGASGIRKDLCGDKLLTVADDDWESFTDTVANFCKEPFHADTPESFYAYYSWDQITSQVAKEIQQCLNAS